MYAPGRTFKTIVPVRPRAADDAPRRINEAACELMRRRLSVHSAANNGPPWPDNDSTGNRTDNRSCNDDGPADAYAACAIHTASADHRVSFGRVHGDEASCQN